MLIRSFLPGGGGVGSGRASGGGGPVGPERRRRASCLKTAAGGKKMTSFRSSVESVDRLGFSGRRRMCNQHHQ